MRDPNGSRVDAPTWEWKTVNWWGLVGNLNIKTSKIATRILEIALNPHPCAEAEAGARAPFTCQTPAVSRSKKGHGGHGGVLLPIARHREQRAYGDLKIRTQSGGTVKEFVPPLGG